MIDRLAIAGYRSIRSLTFGLGPLNVVTGPNGSGKSNLYRALKLLVAELEYSELSDSCVPIRLEKRLGETITEDAGLLAQYWKWPKR
jgi:AAA15 family ATPase/GTPase